MDERISPETGNTLRRDIRPFDVKYKGHTITVDMPGWYGEGDEDSIHSGIDMIVSDRALHTIKARVEGLLEPTHIQRIRKKLKLTQKRASELLGGGTNAFQKYEAGDVLVSQAMSQLLRLLDSQPELLERLEQHASRAA